MKVPWSVFLTFAAKRLNSMKSRASALSFVRMASTSVRMGDQLVPVPNIFCIGLNYGVSEWDWLQALYSRSVARTDTVFPFERRNIRKSSGIRSFLADICISYYAYQTIFDMRQQLQHVSHFRVMELYSVNDFASTIRSKNVRVCTLVAATFNH